MRKVLLIFIVLVLMAAAGYYFIIYKNNDFSEKTDVSKFISKLNFFDSQEISEKNENIGNIAGDLKTKVVDIFAGLSQTWSSTTQKVSDVVAVVDEQTKDGKVAKVISVLGEKSDSSPTGPSSAGDQKKINVCLNFSPNNKVSYLVENPFVGSTSTYSIDWGDGDFEKNVFSVKTVEVSHVYVNFGEFIVKFKVESGEFSDEVSKVVCVR